MNAFIGLMKKEWKLTRMFFILLSALSLLVILGSQWWLSGVGANIEMIPIAILFLLHLFYFPSYLFLSLSSERQLLHVWLHSPQSIHKLLGVKCLMGLFFSILSLCFMTIVGYFMIGNMTVIKPYLGDIRKLTLLVDGYILILSVYFGLFLLLLWTIHQVVKQHIGKYSLMATIPLFFILPLLFDWLQQTYLYTVITDWGLIKIDVFKMFTSFESFAELQDVTIESRFYNFYIGELTFHVLLGLFLYFLASYLLDKKIEV